MIISAIAEAKASGHDGSSKAIQNHHEVIEFLKKLAAGSCCNVCPSCPSCDALALLRKLGKVE